MRGALDPLLAAGDRRQLDHVVIVARARHRRAVEAFDPLGLGAAGAEGGGDVVGDVGAADRQRLQADQHAAGEDRDVGDAAAQLDQRHAQLALLLAQAGLARRDRRGDDRLDAEMGGADAQVEILAPAADRRR